MGYETKLIIGQLTDMKGVKNSDCDWVNVISEIDLCKTGIIPDTYLVKYRDTHKVFIYATDGDTEISKDRYGSQLFAVSPSEVLNLMVKANKKQKYRRYNAAIPLLKSLIKDFGSDLTCVLYGH